MRKHWLILITLSLNILVQAQKTSVDASPWHIVATDFPNYSGIALANGRIGLLSSAKPFQTESLILNNVFDEYMFDSINQCVTSRVMHGINFAQLDMSIDGELLTEKNIAGWEQTLDMKEAKLTTTFSFKDKAIITYSILALRGMPYCGVIQVNVKAKKDIQLQVGGKIICAPEHKNPQQNFKTLRDNEIKMPLLQTVAESQTGKIKLATTATFVFDEECPDLKQTVISDKEQRLDFLKKVNKDTNFEFAWVGAALNSKDFNDPRSESERMVIYIMRGNLKQVIENHIQKWAELWKGDIVIEGDLEAQRDIRLALYHIYAFSSQGSDLSISPMGLSSQGYNGHVFWDTELWMFPPVLVFHPEIAKSYLNYRYNRLGKAKQKAASYGFSGAMFPWESDDTGEEATPTFALTGAFEQHITADIGIAAWNYFRSTGDTLWLKNKGFTMMKEIADFWVSRTVQNVDGTFSINNVVGADEFAPNVNDNAFTNGAVKKALEYATLAAKTLNIEPDMEWKNVASKLKFNYFADGVTKEHQQYKGEIIKQADVNLLAYPLEIVTDRTAILRDLNYYESKISPEGPAMGYSVLAVLHARLGDRDKAYKLFRKAYIPNKKPPFGALSESPTSNNPYFATGAGGLLQVVLFGFGGLHFTESGIRQINPCLPAQWKSLEIKGVGAKKENFMVKK